MDKGFIAIPYFKVEESCWKSCSPQMAWALINRHQILDVALIANKYIDSISNPGQQVFCRSLILRFEKDYDHVCWSFLGYS